MLLPSTVRKKQYTENQTKFMDALRDPKNKGNIRACMTIAGYSKEAPASWLTKELKEELLSIAQEILAAHSIATAMSLTGLIDDPINPAASTIIRAAESILDRVGIVKTERVEVEAMVHNIALLPSRRKPDEEQEA